MTGLTAGAIDLSLRAWTTEFADWIQVRSELAMKVRDGLAEAGIEVPLPQRDLHLRSVSREAARDFHPFGDDPGPKGAQGAPPAA